MNKNSIAYRIVTERDPAISCSHGTISKCLSCYFVNVGSHSMTGTRQTLFSKNPVGFVTAEGIVTRPIPPSVVSHYQPNKID